MPPPDAYGTKLQLEGRRHRPRQHRSGSGSSAVNVEGEDEGFVVLGDDVGAKWDGDQTKYIPLTPSQSAVLTAQTQWKNLDLTRVTTAAVSTTKATLNSIKSTTVAVASTALERGVESVERGADYVSGVFTRLIEIEGREVEDTEKKTAAKNAEQLPDPKSPNANVRGPEGDIMVDSPFKSEDNHYDNSGVSGVWTRPIRSSSIRNRRKNIQEKWALKDDRAAISKKTLSHEEASSDGRAQQSGDHDGSEKDPSLQSTQKELQESRDPTIEGLQSEEGFLPTMITDLRRATHEARLHEASRAEYSK